MSLHLLVHVTGEGGEEECQMDEELVDEIESVHYRPVDVT